MAFSAIARTLGTKTQVSAGTFTQPNLTTDCYPCANQRLTIDTITVENPEYTGTIHKPGPAVVGSTASVTFTQMLRGPGGVTPPAAGVFVPGRWMKAAGFTENILAAAIPVAAEVLGVGSTTTMAKLGTTAVGTVDLYKGLALNLSDNGVGYLKQLTAIRSYLATKDAALFETLGIAPAANYQIPKQLAYQLSGAAPTDTLSMSAWLGKIRYDLVDMVPTGMKINMPAAGRNPSALPSIEWTFEGKVQLWADEDAPVITPLGNPPPLRDGDFAIAGLKLGGSSATIDMGIRAAYPDNPNFADGYEAGVIVETQRSATFQLNHNLKAVVDFHAIAQAQSNQGFWAQWGLGSGASVMINVPNGRLKFPSPGDGTEFLDQAIEMLIDDAVKAINVVYSY
jgi:hypothetical protein